MKKKFMLIGVMLVVCFGILFGIKSIQKTPATGEVQNNSVAAENVIKEEAQKEESKQEKNNDSQTLAASENSNQNSATSNAETDTAKTQEQNKSEVTKPAAKANTAASNSTANNNKATSSNSTTNNTKIDTQKPVAQEPNLIITNTITGEKILETNMSFDGMTAAQATITELNKKGIHYTPQGAGESIYFSEINKLVAKGISGWCYYVNGKKMNVGSGAYTLKKEDKLEWKYLKDGLSN
ncbi:DUF4430 domain-containing protein [Clostridium sp. YIM B02515]|uniref:DUF4430 domain-containing protein n=1 Tax=Clostridium rhizosphaerae TaxID=2803861 RepID=A0ABS1T7E4_9CLOT|nr:DUF4430 domain-containing protein [Clostridium rhizosphaerae]MBL4935266.1 DUF4430 domain-containing protein [Clostridium rhizosphaerae]